KGMPSPRPLTHDLVASVIENMGGELQDIYISELREHTYFAKLRIRHEGELVEVDCRPSDAIALAVTAKVPIFVAEDVIGEACGEQKLCPFARRLDIPVRPEWTGTTSAHTPSPSCPRRSRVPDR